MKLLKNIGLMMIAVLLINTSFAQEMTVQVGGAPSVSVKEHSGKRP
jgi:hypothetical protein